MYNQFVAGVADELRNTAALFTPPVNIPVAVLESALKEAGDARAATGVGNTAVVSLLLGGVSFELQFPRSADAMTSGTKFCASEWATLQPALTREAESRGEALTEPLSMDDCVGVVTQLLRNAQV